MDKINSLYNAGILSDKQLSNTITGVVCTSSTNSAARNCLRGFNDHPMYDTVDLKRLANIYWQTTAKEVFNNIINASHDKRLPEYIAKAMSIPDVESSLSSVYNLTNRVVLGNMLLPYESVVSNNMNYKPSRVLGETSHCGDSIKIFSHELTDSKPQQTLIHEMAHAAASKLGLAYADHHGDVFQYILRKLTERTGIEAKELTVPHTTPFVTMCSSCKTDCDELYTQPSWNDIVIGGYCPLCKKSCKLLLYKREMTYEGTVFKLMEPRSAFLFDLYNSRITEKTPFFLEKHGESNLFVPRHISSLVKKPLKKSRKRVRGDEEEEQQKIKKIRNMFVRAGERLTLARTAAARLSKVAPVTPVVVPVVDDELYECETIVDEEEVMTETQNAVDALLASEQSNSVAAVVVDDVDVIVIDSDDDGDDDVC
ncbi:hypothetical protein AbHV_ORF58 [Abalone herpesvirus Victoria/AUS/2009]|uniref:SprT-like domain-containing protein n=1 Tax=Abalone herpesvirus (isolate Abalone/Australia/Victoria/2009) TaxID=1241371 RepID=K4JX61_ABHV|nr:hypothetical protein AbHV_ORF58 [Abalone herpesvirus Victoria/AUS/2009]AFU90070.1 hypothetical protein AbHV_ORF58 [Abalone herpesvirus Victoria/AUS/2009]